jgi:2-(1,2-epoxy-1,2-dihydrophenyl)acetyl-CoA isomerase
MFATIGARGCQAERRSETDHQAVVSVKVEASGGVLTLRLDRPERKNALDAAGVRTMVEALEAAWTDDHLRVVVISSAGEDFCSGADWVATNRADAPKPRTGNLQRRVAVQAHRLVDLIAEIQLPVLCGVRGWAAGLGFQLALAADFTIAATDACFWEPFLERGFSPDGGSTWLLPRLVGVARAKELLLLGRKVTGQEAADWGMIFKAVPSGALDSELSELTRSLSEGPTISIGLAKRSLHRALTTGLTEAMEAEALALELASRTGDFREGLAAFSEKRRPRFEGR